MTDLPLDGTVHAGFEPVRDVLAEVLLEQPGTGAAVAAWYDGAWVVDLWGGYADAAHTRPWARDSIVMPYSVTKPFAAVCVLVLVDRGLVDLDEPMSTYWPGFTAPATVRQVLAHQAGVVVLDEDLPTEALLDPGRVRRALERQRPMWEPGSAHGEAALVRAVELTGYDEEFRRGLEEYGPLMRRALGNPPGALDPAVVSSTGWRRAEIAAVNGHGTARAVAGLYEALTQEGLLSPELAHEATRPHAAGQDRVLGQDASWGLGFGVDDEGFGMGGVGGSYGWWSRVGGYAFAFLTGHIGDPGRGDRLENAFREVLGLPSA